MGKGDFFRNFDSDTILGILVLVIIFFIGRSVYNNNFRDYNACVERAIEKNDFVKAHKLVDKMAELPDRKENKWENYRTAYYLTLNAEVNYLLNDNSPMGVERLVALFQSKTMGAVPVTGLVSSKDAQHANDRYNTSVARHHAVMDNVISRAIATKNEYLATQMVQCYRPILKKKVAEYHLFKADEYEYYYSYEPKENAEARVNQAIQEGKFK